MQLVDYYVTDILTLNYQTEQMLIILMNQQINLHSRFEYFLCCQLLRIKESLW